MLPPGQHNPLPPAPGNNIGKALQKQATTRLPRLSARPEVVAAYLQSRSWLLGVAADLGGGLLMIAAFARAPVSVVQPVSSVGLVFLMIFAHFHLKVGASRHAAPRAGAARNTCQPRAWGKPQRTSNWCPPAQDAPRLPTRITPMPGAPAAPRMGGGSHSRRRGAASGREQRACSATTSACSQYRSRRSSSSCQWYHRTT